MFKDKAGNFSPFKLVLTILVVILAVIFLGSSFVVIPAGHTGVALTFGKVEDVVLQEGLHFKVPFVQKIVVVDNRIVKLDVNTEAFSKDLQTITTVVAVNYHVGKENSQTLYKNVGMGFEEVLITPAVNEVLKAVTAKYTAVELVSSRAEVSMLLDDGLNEKLNAYGIFINELNIINWDFSEEYIKSRPAPSRSRPWSSPTRRPRSGSSPPRRRPTRSRSWPRPTPSPTGSSPSPSRSSSSSIRPWLSGTASSPRSCPAPTTCSSTSP